MQFDIPFNNEDEENENPSIPNMQGFMITPNGPVPINRNTLSSLFHGKRKSPCCTIFNGEYIIYSLNNDTESLSHLLFECVKNPDHRGPLKYSLLDAYDYLDTTHFLNFMISKKYDKHIWAYEGTTLQIQIMNSEKDAYSKLLIIIEPSDCSDYIINYSSNDMHYETQCEQITVIRGIPIMAKIIKGKSYYAPIITYHVSFALNSNSPINFQNIHISNFYSNILQKFIKEAIANFYSGSMCCDDIGDIGEHLVRVNFDINYDNNIFNIRIICTPSIYINPNTKKAHKYIFTSMGHLISVYPINDTEFNMTHDLIQFANNIFSSKSSQLVTLDIYKQGTIFEYCEEYHIYKSFDVLCTQERFLIRTNERFINDPKYNDNQRIFSNFAVLKSDYPEVINYWKPYDDIVNLSIIDYKFDMNILGFINFDTELICGKRYSDIFQSIANEIFEIFGYNIKDFESQNIKIIPCYETTEVYRVILYKINDTNKNIETTDSKKKSKTKFRLFGGE